MTDSKPTLDLQHALKAQPRLLFVVNDEPFFARHFGMLAHAARARGFDIHLATPSGTPRSADLREFTYHQVSFSRSGTNLVAEMRAIARLIRLLRTVRPALVHGITIKPVIYGGLASRLLRVNAIHTIPGLGYVFLARGLRARILRAIACALYRLALAGPLAQAVFQNRDDRTAFVAGRLVPASQAHVILGSGVESHMFPPTPMPSGPPLVVLPARMLWDKGVEDFVSAARILRSEGVSARFALVGDTDPENPAAVPREQLREWSDEGSVEWWGHRTDMPQVLAAASIVCLPSYREGIPRVLIEAASVGRPLIATDVPGCREIVRSGDNGLLVPPRNPPAFADALRSLIWDEPLRKSMARRSREIAATDLSPERIIGQYLALYERAARPPS